MVFETLHRDAALLKALTDCSMVNANIASDSNGIILQINAATTHISGHDEMFSIALMNDITERKQTELAFARRSMLEAVPIDFNAEIQSAIRLLRHTINPDIRIKTKLAVGLGSVLIDPARLQTTGQVFEPLFTTKPAGHGTGLWLAMVHGFIHQAGGLTDV